MESRIVKTKFWRDTKVQKMSKDARFLFIYLITCPYINLCGIFELPDVYMEIETGIDEEELKKAKEELQQIKRAFFYEGWVYIPRARDHNRYHVGPKTRVAYERQVENVPQNIKDGFKALNDSTIIPVRYYYDTPTILPEIRNKNTEYINDNTESNKDYIDSIDNNNKREDKVLLEDINPEDIPF